MVKFTIYPLAMAVYVVALFLPVDGVARFGGAGENFNFGWQAALIDASSMRAFFSFSIFDRHYWGSPRDVRDVAVLALMFAANVFMVISPILVYRSRPRVVRWSCYIFLFPVLATLSPMFFTFMNYPREHWLIGYYVWFSSVTMTYISLVVSALTVSHQFRSAAFSRVRST